MKKESLIGLGFVGVAAYLALKPTKTSALAGNPLSKLSPDSVERLKMMIGSEISSLKYADVVGVSKNGEVIRAGEVIDVLDTDEKVKELFDEMFEGEFGTSDVNALLEEEFGPRKKNPKRSKRKKKNPLPPDFEHSIPDKDIYQVMTAISYFIDHEQDESNEDLFPKNIMGHLLREGFFDPVIGKTTEKGQDFLSWATEFKPRSF